MRTAYDTVETRYRGAQFALSAAKAGYNAAEIAAEDALSAYKTGVGKLQDVQTADEMRLNAQLAIIQAEAQRQAVAFESMLLTGTWESYLNSGELK